jgi:hypothetical protein
MRPARRVGIAFLILAVSIPLLGCAGVDFHSPSTIMHRSLPLVLKAFGPRARLQTLTLNDVEADYAVLTSDGIFHRRSYRCGIHFCPGGLLAAEDIPATRFQRSEALVPLGLLNTAVPDRLLSKLGISGGEAQLMLEGRTWTIRDSHRIFYHWQARYDGAGLHPSQTPADIPGASVSPSAPRLTRTAGTSTPSGSSQTTAGSTHTATHPKRATAGTATTPSTYLPPPAQEAQRLLACVKAARQDVTKLLACQKRFKP